MLYVAMRFPNAEHPRAFIRASLPLAAVNAVYNRLSRSMIPVTIGLIIASLVICAFITRRLSRPVAEMRSVAEKVSRGEFNARILIDRRDEFGDLAEAFNRMTAEIQALFDRLSGQKEELETVLTAISEGLALIDHDHRIAKANQTFLDQVKCPEAVGKPYWEVIRNPQFAEALRQTREAGASRRVELTLGECIYLCSFASLPLRGGVVVIFFDITEMKRLETIKKDLVVNISHEFKTPLTAIRGFAEALEEDPTQHREYVETIKRNADRLSAITSDLLLLARLEYKEKPLVREALDLKAVVGDTAAIFQAMLKDKNLNLSISAEEGLPAVMGDRFMLEQVFTNLLENAIKYTDAGGIRIALDRRERFVAVTVSDTGIGIPAEHLPRIFERFYTVDKSRSRRHGGTGLGLAIVRNIVLQHGGELSVRSTPGQGTTFTFTIPVA